MFFLSGAFFFFFGVPVCLLIRGLLGPLSLALQFDAAHFTAKRPSGLPAVRLDAPFDPNKFNFAKVPVALRVGPLPSFPVRV